MNPSFFKYESFLGLGFESVFINVIAGIVFGFLIGIYPLFVSILPYFPNLNLFLFVAYGIPLTGSTHYTPRLGVLSSVMLLFTARTTQLLFGVAPNSQGFFMLAGLWSAAQVFLIGYLPGKIIPTSENLKYLFNGMAKVTLLYAFFEYAVYVLARKVFLPPSTILVFPFYSIPLLIIVSTSTAFFFTNIFCPYMMIPLISRTVKGQRYCGTGNFVFKLGSPITLDDAKITKASKKGFKLVSKLPTVTVFSCPHGGMISVYYSGNLLVRKVNVDTAERINRHLTPILFE
jgi:hypothetical protein